MTTQPGRPINLRDVMPNPTPDPGDVATYQFGEGITGRIVIDEDTGDSPREWDNLGTLVYWSKRYILGDVDGARQYGGKEHFFKEALSKKFIMLPLYMLNGTSPLVMWTPDEDIKDWKAWAERQRGVNVTGWIFATRKKVREEYNVSRVTKWAKATAISVLRQEVKTFAQYLRNEVFGYRVDGPNGLHDSCYGMYGETDYVYSEMVSAAEVMMLGVLADREDARLAKFTQPLPGRALNYTEIQ